VALFIIEIVVEGSRDEVKILHEWGPVYELFFFFMKIQSCINLVLTKYQQL
jgi:hypothetical protein